MTARKKPVRVTKAMADEFYIAYCKERSWVEAILADKIDRMNRERPHIKRALRAALRVAP